MNGKFVILDGSSLMYRAFYALPLLTASTGEYTNAIFGFSNMLTKLLQELAPDALVIAFDKGKQTFRNEIFPEYKGTRQKTPEELKAQIPLLHDFASAFGLAFVEKAGYEADDIIGTLATRAALSDYDT
ncbi:MAG: DNA polymerase I, partial [Selenomonadaceae bacterium]|nr:DNA polymerase I [Selenomonadaceae bacterium]